MARLIEDDAVLGVSEHLESVVCDVEALIVGGACENPVKKAVTEAWRLARRHELERQVVRLMTGIFLWQSDPAERSARRAAAIEAARAEVARHRKAAMEDIDAVLAAEWDKLAERARGMAATVLGRTPETDTPSREAVFEVSYSPETGDERVAELERECRRLRNIINGNRLGTWEWDIGTGAVRCNDHWAEMLGYSLAEIAPATIDTWKEMTHPDDLAIAMELLERHFNGESEVYDVHVRMRQKDGHWIWVHDKGRVAEWTAEGKPRVMYGAHQDVTAYYEAKAALAASERFLRSTLKSLKDLVFIIDRNGVFLNCHQPSENDDLLVAPSEFIGKHYASVLPAEVSERFDGMMARLQEDGGAESFDYALEIDGKTRWFNAKATRREDGAGRFEGVTAVVRNVTKRVAAERELLRETRAQKFLMRLASKYINIPLTEVDAAVETALKEMGEYISADRAYLFDYDFEKETTSNIYEWCNDGIVPQIDELQEVPLSETPDWVAVHLKGEPMIIPDVLSLPPSGLRDILEPQGIKSLAAVPLMHGGKPLGFVGFDAVHAHHLYSEKDIDLLRLFAQIVVNIRLRTESEQALQERETNFRTFFNTIGDLLFILDMEGNIIELNETVIRRLGYPAKDLLGRSILMVHPKDRREEAEATIQRMLRGEEDHCPAPLLRRDGGLIPVETYVTPGQWNGKPALFGVSKDISKLKRSEEKFAAAFHFSPAVCGFSRVDTGEFIEVNRTFQEQLGHTAEEVIGRRATDILGIDPDIREAMVREALKYGGIQEMELTVFHKDGTPRDMLFSAKPLDLEEGPLLFTTVIDITRRKAVERELDDHRHRLEELVAERTRDLEQTNRWLQSEMVERREAEGMLAELVQQRSRLVDFGHTALSGISLDRLFKESVSMIGEVLNTRYTGVLEYLAAARCFRMRAGEICENTLIAKASGDPSACEMPSVNDGAAAILEMFSKEEQSFVNYSGGDGPIYGEAIVAIPGSGRPYGVIGVQTQGAEQFRVNDIQFIESVANLLAVAIQRKASETEAKRLAKIVEQAVEGVAVADMSGRIEFANRAWATMHGYHDGESLVGRKLRDFYTQASHFGKEVKHRGHYTGEVRHHRKDGTTFPGFMISSLLRDESDTPYAVACFAQDITEQKQAEAEKAEMEKRMQQSQRMETIGTLAGGIAHDFNNLLQPILGYADIGLMTLPESHEVRGDFEAISNAARRATDLVRQILYFSRQMEKERAPLALQYLLKEVMKLLRHSLPATIEINYEIDPKCGMVSADASQIHQVVMNLCTNAFHAMEETGGALTLKLAQIRLDERATVNSPHLSPGDYARLTVVDTGCGIPPEIKERIFEPFFTTKKVGKGTGLGLSVVHGIVREHGGDIAVKSRRKQGTTFHVFLPVINGDEEPECVPEEQPEAKGDHETILVVDDEQAIVRMMERMLGLMGYEVVGTTSSPEALRRVEAEPGRYNLLVTDLTMPDMTGIELIEAVRRIRVDLPIILITGYAEKVSKKMTRTYDINQVMIKPVIAGEFGQTVREVLDQHKGDGCKQP